LARLQELELLTELSPQASGGGGFAFALDELLELLPAYGLELLAPPSLVKCAYAQDANALARSSYECPYWQCLRR
jgi:hypothetical protein